MVKAADAFAADGWHVRVVATAHEPWAVAADVDVRARRTWPVTVVDYRRLAAPAVYWPSGVRFRCARILTSALGANRAPIALAVRAYARVHSEIMRAAAAVPADLLYGGTTGAIGAVAAAAQRIGVPYGVDFEDLHSAESDGPDAEFVGALAARIEARVGHAAAFVTTSSAAIAAEYSRRYGIDASPVLNTFPLPAVSPEFARADPERLRVYWFSQTIGPGRGLEHAIAALGRAGVGADLSLRGRPLPGYFASLSDLAARQAPHLRLHHLPPAAPDAMVDLARGQDVGLALEREQPLNRRLAISNKAFTYVLAGLAVAMTDLPGQHMLGVDLGEAAALVSPDDVERLAAAFVRWHTDPSALDRAKRAAWAAAVRRWHWEHEDDRGRLQRLARSAVA